MSRTARSVALAPGLLAAALLAALLPALAPPHAPGAAPAGGPLADPLPDIAAGPHTVRLELVADGLAFPTHVVAAPDGSGRLFITLVNGIVRVVDGGVLLPTPFVDLSAMYAPDKGSAMASLAFHPDFATNRTLYVILTEDEDPALADFGVTTGVAHQSVLYELRALGDHPSPDANVWDPTSLRELLRINEDSTIHNMDALAFGPDGYLYVAKGDDETGGQDTTTIHGAILRLDVDRLPGNPLSANGEYAIPADNPFVGAGGGVVEETWAYGFRNPWRMTFDRETGALWVADVGEADIEEVGVAVAGGNHGWPHKEGAFAKVTGGVSDDLSGLPPLAFVDPVGQYDHGEGNRSITGGIVARDLAHPEFFGRYVFGDWISGRLFELHPGTGNVRSIAIDPAGETVNGQLSGAPVEGIISVSEGAAGELLLVVTPRNMTPTARVLRVAPGTWVGGRGSPGGSSSRPVEGPPAPLHPAPPAPGG